MTLGRIRAIGIAAALIVAALLQWAGPLRTSQPVFDLWQKMAPRDLGGTPVRIVWIDDKAVAELGLWPWPRRLMSLLVSRIAAAQPKVIAFDIMFLEPDIHGPKQFVLFNPEIPPALASQLGALPDYDEELANAIGLAPVVLGRAGVDAVRLADAREFVLLPRFAKPLPPSVRSWTDLATSLEAIDSVGLGHGLLNGDPDRDGTVRRVPLVAKVAGKDLTGLAFETALAANGIEQTEFLVNGAKLSALKLGNRYIRVSPDGTLIPKLGRMPAGTEFSAFDIFDGAIPAGALRGAIVIVAVKAAGTADQVATVLEPNGYGATVQANAVDTVLRGGELVRPGWAWLAEGLATVLLVAMAVRLVPVLRGRHVLPLTIIAIFSLFAISLAGYKWGNLLLDPVGPAATVLATGIVMLMLLFSRSRRLLEEEKLAAASAQGELNAARAIQLGMLPPAEALAALDARVEVGGLIEPARSIGGDFFDAVRLGPDQLCFLVGDVSGKGVPAALFMALSKALAKSALLRDGGSLAEAVAQIAEDVSRDNAEDMFVTMMVAVLDAQSGAVQLCAAGHEYPWIIRRDGSVEMVKPDGGPPLGVAPGFAYGASAVMLAPGETLVIVSDGITEARAPDGGFFEHDRLRQILAGWRPDCGVAALSSALRDAVRAFEQGEDATDDLTVLAFRYRGAGAI